MSKVAAQVLVSAPAQKVWEVLADFGGIYNWAPGVTNSYSTSESNGGPGSSRHCDIAGFGSIEEYVTEWTEGREFKYRATPVGPIGESISTWRVTPQGNRAVLYGDLEYKMRFGLLGALLNTLFMGRMMQQYGATMGQMTPELQQQMQKQMLEQMGEILTKHGAALKQKAEAAGK